MKYIKPPDFKSVREFQAHYKKIERDITELLTTDGSARTAKELNEKLSQALNAAISYLTKANKEFAQSELPKAFDEGKTAQNDLPKVLSAEEASEILEKQGYKYARKGFSRDTYIELQTATQAAGNGLKSRVNSIIDKLHKTGQDSVYNVQQAIIKDLSERSLFEVKYSNGAKMPLWAYAAMAARSARIESANIGAIGRAVEAGTDLVKMTTVPQCCKLCGAYQGKVYSISGKDKRFPALFKTVLRSGYALPHPNCRHEFIPWFEEMESPEDVKEAMKNSKIKYDKQGNLVDVRYQSDIKGYAAWQAGNRQLNRELLEYNRMKEYYGENAPYKTLAGFRRANRARSSEFKQYKQVWTGKGLTMSESDVIITSENIKRALGEKTRTLQEAIQKSDKNVSQAFERYQSQLKIVDAHYKRDKDHNYQFDSRKGGILFDIEADSLPGDNSRKQFSTYFHETGHNLDYVIGKKLGVGFASGGYKSPTFNSTFNQMITEEGRDFIERYRDIVWRRTGKAVISNEEVYREICLDFKSELVADIRQLSDILDGITNGQMRKSGYSLGSSHTIRDKDYWRKHPVGEEAFAHFTSILGTNPKMKEMYMEIFPKSFQIYMEIIKQ